MINEFVSFGMPRSMLLELYKASVSQFMMESTLRYEQGLEPIEPPPFFERCERMLGLTDEQAHAIFHEVEEDLWAYTWFTYTDEWAWYRAEQEAEKELKGAAKNQNEQTRERLIARKYREQFDRYISEVDMHAPELKREKRQRKK